MTDLELLQRARQFVPLRETPSTLKPADPLDPPPIETPTTNPRRHDVVAWRHCGPLETTRHATKEMALEFARALSWVVYWKYAVMDGRDMIERAVIDPPGDMSASDVELILG